MLLSRLVPHTLLSVFLQSLPCLLPISLFLFSSPPVPVFLSLSLCFLSDIRFVCLTRPHNNACAEFPGPGLVMVMAKSWEGPGLWDATYLERAWNGVGQPVWAPVFQGLREGISREPVEAGPHSSWGVVGLAGGP